MVRLALAFIAGLSLVAVAGLQQPAGVRTVHDKAKIDHFQAYLRDVWTEVNRLKQQGVSAKEAAKQADLTKHKEHFPTIQAPGAAAIHAILRPCSGE